MGVQFIIQTAVAKLLKLPLPIKSVILLYLLYASLQGTGKVNQLLQDSLAIKERLTQFDKIQENIESCWTPLREISLFLGCLSNDDRVMADISFLLSSCFLQQNDLPPIQCKSSIRALFCIPPKCPHTCATIQSEKVLKKFGFNVFLVIYEGVQKFCYSVNKRENSDILKMKIPWDQISSVLTHTEGSNALIIRDADNERIKNLKHIFRYWLDLENVTNPFQIYTQVKSNPTYDKDLHQLNI